MPPEQLLGVAEEHAALRVPVTAPAQTAGEVRAALTGERFECADDVAVVDEGRLVGLVQIEALLAAAADALVAEIMDPDPPVVAPGTDQEIAARRMVERAESTLAVVDSEGRFRGLIPPHRMLGVLLDEHDEDLARLGGYLAGTRRARRAAEERVISRLAHRVPWLLLGLVGAMASAVIVGAFEHQLDTMVVLAFFVPAVVYIADAVGTQTETVLIRGLSVGVPLRSVAHRELATGVLLGAIVGAAFLPSRCSGGAKPTWRSRWPSPWSRAARSRRWSRWRCRGSFSGSAATPRSAPGRWRRWSRTCSRSPCIWGSRRRS